MQKTHCGSVMATLSRAVCSPSYRNTMKQTKIDLSESFENVLRAVLSTPEDDKGIGEGAGQNGTSSVLAKAVNRGSASKTELERVLRSLYEAAHGRQGETQIGLVAS